ncbi:50S ribosomal protein L15 [Sulfodiicoccus acidiphilus]|uniref:Large ribosomal subunit protein uL15 n=1 Tax=Sulfodiicoccus acidiphilus TaxID=1670455 RepID=A0A348B164_9CREN|nr:uL15 family ribosomal protein [Sulfodiicoccus acidiphilus]BBD71916.1 50S ribosomal protein L15 [Sulfodiicoccus acidiphilus]GGT91436.1 50S ribosomal protein L15 [Sulfodiicoccus acidiphilus]
MVIRKEKKSRSKRGSRTVGWGKVGQHRDRGSESGRQIGMGKHKWSWVVKFAPRWYGKHGFKNPTTVPVHAITLKDLQAGIESGRFKFKEEGGKKLLDLSEHGIDKVISGGDFYAGGIAIKVGAITERARSKIEGAGAEVILNSGQ